MLVNRWTDPVAFFVNGIGDHFINLPALRALAARCEGQLTLVCADHPVSELFDQLPLRRIVRIERRLRDEWTAFDWSATAAAVGPCDLFVSLAPYASASLERLMQALQPHASIGFHVGRQSEKSPFTSAVWLDRRKHSGHSAFQIVKTVWPDLVFEDWLEPPRFPPSTYATIRAIKSELPAGTKILAVHPETRARKMWAKDSFSAVLTRFLSDYPDYICAVVATRDPGIDFAAIEDRIIPTYSSAVDATSAEPIEKCVSLWTAFCLVAESQLFLGVDSCCLHVADLCRVPCVALFGPTSSTEFGCLTAPNRTLQGQGTMQSIHVDDVMASLREIVHA